MSDADFSAVLNELEAMESDLEAIRVAVDEGEETFVSAPTARQEGMRHLEMAVRHVTDSSWALIEEADWDEPEDNLDAIEILAEEDVIPGRLAVELIGLAEYAAEHGEESGWDVADEGGLFERLGEASEAFAEYLEYVHQFLKEWEEE